MTRNKKYIASIAVVAAAAAYSLTRRRSSADA